MKKIFKKVIVLIMVVVLCLSNGIIAHAERKYIVCSESSGYYPAAVLHDVYVSSNAISVRSLKYHALYLKSTIYTATATCLARNSITGEIKQMSISITTTVDYVSATEAIVTFSPGSFTSGYWVGIGFIKLERMQFVTYFVGANYPAIGLITDVSADQII